MYQNIFYGGVALASPLKRGLMENHVASNSVKIAAQITKMLVTFVLIIHLGLEYF